MNRDDTQKIDAEVIELPTLDARHLEVIQCVVGAVLLDSLMLHTSLLLGKPTRPGRVSEKFLRSLTIELVKQARVIYNQPYNTRDERFQAIIEYVSNECHGIAGLMLEERRKEAAKHPVILDAMGQPVRG